jgi:hypothetical protein
LSLFLTFTLNSVSFLQRELEHVTKALESCGYPKWALHRGANPPKRNKTVDDPSKECKKEKHQVALPYIKGLSEELRRTLRQHGRDAYFKPTNTLRQLLCAPKDPAKKEEKSGVIYRIECEGEKEGQGCGSSYIGETGRTLKARAAEHRRPSTSSSEVSQHLHLDGRPNHHVSLENISILDQEQRWFERGVKEAAYIRLYHPDLNRDGGRFHLPHVWDNILTSCDHRSHDNA